MLPNPDSKEGKGSKRVGRRLNIPQEHTNAAADAIPFVAEAFRFTNETFLMRERGIISAKPFGEDSSINGGKLLGLNDLITLTGWLNDVIPHSLL